jgi:broad specificity phosphatase PhoE
MILYLVRHGRSRANEAGLVTGTPEDTLSDEGVAQALSLASWLQQSGCRAQRYVTSRWIRAQQTATRLQPDVEWEIDARVGETSAGEVAEWPLSRFLSHRPDFYTDPANRYPGGESHLDLNKRVLEWLDEQLARRTDILMLVAHSGPISCILQDVLGLPMKCFPAFLPAHASLSAVEMKTNNGKRQGRLIGFSLCPPENLPEAFYGNRKGAIS